MPGLACGSRASLNAPRNLHTNRVKLCGAIQPRWRSRARCTTSCSAACWRGSRRRGPPRLGLAPPPPPRSRRAARPAPSPPPAPAASHCPQRQQRQPRQRCRQRPQQPAEPCALLRAMLSRLVGAASSARAEPPRSLACRLAARAGQYSPPRLSPLPRLQRPAGQREPAAQPYSPGPHPGLRLRSQWRRPHRCRPPGRSAASACARPPRRCRWARFARWRR
jgi:hypothetical protein